MMTSTKPSRPIEFSGDLAALAHTLGLPTSEIRAAIAGLIERGYLERVTGSTWRLKPAR
jgi:DNA-binding IclR family transcriptional regulator